MPRVSSFLLGVAAGMMLFYGATNYHVVRARDGFHLVPKSRAQLAETYVDVRSFGVGDWANHADLTAALVAANQQSLLDTAASNSIQNSVQNLPSWPQR